MSAEQIVTVLVLVGVVGALISNRVRADVAALTGAAVLLMSGAVRPVEVQAAFASPAIIALASLFVIAYAMELSGLLDALIRVAASVCRMIGAAGIWVIIILSGGASAFLNNTPIVVLAAPVVRNVAGTLGLSPRRFLIPLSYMAVLGGCCTLIGTSTNLLVNDMARVAGQPQFGIFEISPVGIVVAATGGLYLLLFSRRFIRDEAAGAMAEAAPPPATEHLDVAGAPVGSAELFAPQRPLRPLRAIVAITVFVAVVTVAALGYAPIAASAFAGAVLLILLRVITPNDAYGGLRPEILLLIAGMVVIGIALEQTGLANIASQSLVGSLESVHPLIALVLLYGATLFLTELLSNATVAVLITPLAVGLAEALAVSPRPFLVAVMIAASAAFATPFGYQTNVVVYQMGGYSYMDFVRVGLPLNLITWVAAAIAIPFYFPF